MPESREDRPPLVSHAGRSLEEVPILVWNVHSHCNCRCVMCDIWKRQDFRELDPTVLDRQRDSLLQLKVRRVVFTGGEPLLHRSLGSICAFFRRQGIALTLLTTGLLLAKRAAEVAEFFEEVIVSLDGPESVHDAIRRIPGAFRCIERGVAALRECGVGLRIAARCTVQKANFRELRATVAAAKALKLDGISFLAADLHSTAFNRPQPWPPERRREVALDLPELQALEEEIERMIGECAEEIEGGYIAEEPAKLRRLAQSFRAYLGLVEPRSPRCNAPWVSAVIETDGSVRPCFFHPPIGSIAGGSLDAAINGQVARNWRAKLSIPEDPVCRRCVCSLYYQSNPDEKAVIPQDRLECVSPGGN